jgi:iron complex transport system ATP-binding protein
MSRPDPGCERLGARELDCGYGRGDVLSDVTLGVEPGKVLALLGPNGSGKTTLLRTLAQLLEPRGGAVLLDGQPVGRRDRDRVRRRVAASLPDDAGGSTLTVAEVVRLGRAAHRGWWRPMTPDDLASVEKALALAHLVGLCDRPVSELSSGEWQRVMLARALAREPAALLLDEPTAHLDLHFQVEILELVETLAHEGGLAVVVSLHDVNQAAFWADSIALVAEGRLLAVGSPAEVLTTEMLRRAYGCALTVERHPESGLPMVLPRRRTRGRGEAGGAAG